MLLLYGKPFSVSSLLHAIHRFVVIAGGAVVTSPLFISPAFSHTLSPPPPTLSQPMGLLPALGSSSCHGLCYAPLFDSLCGWPLPFLEVEF